MEWVTSADGTKIAYDRYGDGPPLVVIAGALCDRGRSQPIAEHLGGGFTTFNYDRRGRGNSGDTAPYAIDREVEDLRALVDVAGGSAVVYAHSSGAALAIHAAAAGVAIDRLVLHEPPYSPATQERRTSAEAYAQELNALLGEGREDDAVALFFRLVGVPGGMVEQWRGEPWWPATVSLGRSLAYDSAVVGHAENGAVIPAELLSRVNPPALVLIGSASPEWVREIGQQIADLLPHGTHALLPGHEHVAPPDVVGPIVSGFLLTP